MAEALYVHIPFCDAICAYCDFFRCGYHRGLSDHYLDALSDDILHQQVSKNLKTIYIGGGTPSALQVDQLDKLFLMLAPYQLQVAEYTIEVNVESLTDEKIACMKAAGINRVSMGVQSFQEDSLALMNRKHRKQDIMNAIQACIKAGIHNISIDLIYGLPNQTLAMWKQDLLEAIALPITHLSLYALTIEEHSAFGRAGMKNIDAILEGDMYDLAIEMLVSAGFHQYEISSFAKASYESKHNKAYWCYQDFYGLGCGASGKLQHRRYDMPKNMQHYIQGLQVPTWISLSKQDEMFEMVMMGLRLKEGLSYQRFKDYFQISFDEVYREAKLKNIQNGSCYEVDDKLCTTEHGFHFLNDVLLDFL